MKFIKTFEQTVGNLYMNKTDFFAKFEKGTKIYFKDIYNEYIASLYSVKPFGDKIGLIFELESGDKITIEEKLYISDSDLYKISLLDVKIEEHSEELLRKMFSYLKSNEIH